MALVSRLSPTLATSGFLSFSLNLSCETQLLGPTVIARLMRLEPSHQFIGQTYDWVHPSVDVDYRGTHRDYIQAPSCRDKGLCDIGGSSAEPQLATLEGPIRQHPVIGLRWTSQVAIGDAAPVAHNRIVNGDLQGPRYYEPNRDEVRAAGLLLTGH